MVTTITEPGSQQILAVSQGMAGCGGMFVRSHWAVDTNSGTVSFVLLILPSMIA
jgi:hypothetical protein